MTTDAPATPTIRTRYYGNTACGCAGCQHGMTSPNIPRTAWMGLRNKHGQPFHRSNKPSHRHNRKGGR